MNRTTLLGVLGGSLTSISGLVGYFVYPLLSGGRHWSEMGYEAFQTFSGSPYSYHVLVLVVPSFAATFLGGLVARRTGLASKWTDVELLAWNVGIPFLVAIASYVFSSVVLAAAFAAGASGILEGVLTFALFLGYGLVFGLVFASLVISGVLVAVLAGSAGGVVLARGVALGWRAVGDL